MTWYFSRALGMIGLFAGAVRVALAVILADEGGVDLLGSVGTGILLMVGGMLAGVVVDVIVHLRRRPRSREPGRGGRSRRR